MLPVFILLKKHLITNVNNRTDGNKFTWRSLPNRQSYLWNLIAKGMCQLTIERLKAGSGAFRSRKKK